MDILIDYLTISFRHIKYYDMWDILNADFNDFQECHSYFGYEKCLKFSGIALHFNLDNKMQSDSIDKVCLDLSGQGCRTVESLNPAFDWKYFLLYFMIDESFRVSRIDIACDDKDGILNMNQLFQFIRNNKYICKARYILPAGDISKSSEQWIYFGSPKSERRLRIYNKALERGVEEHWIRAELQLRDETAQSFINNYFKYDDLGKCYCGVLNDFVRFVTEPYDGQHSERYSNSRFWDNFIQTAGKIQRYLVGGLEYNLERLERVVYKQCASSLKTYLQYYDGDMTELLKVLGTTQLNPQQREFLRNKQILNKD